MHRSPARDRWVSGQPEKIRGAFAGGWVHSGDLGYIDANGYLWVVDRKKDMIKTDGENVPIREAEEVLYELDRIREAAVFPIPHPRWIEAVTAVVVPDPGIDLDEESVVEHCRGCLAGYKVAKFVVIAEPLSKNPSGKILKRELRDQFRRIATAAP